MSQTDLLTRNVAERLKQAITAIEEAFEDKKVTIKRIQMADRKLAEFLKKSEIE